MNPRTGPQGWEKERTETMCQTCGRVVGGVMNLTQFEAKFWGVTKKMVHIFGGKKTNEEKLNETARRECFMSVGEERD